MLYAVRRRILDVSLPFLIEQSKCLPELENLFVNLREFLESEYRAVIALMMKYGVKSVSGVNVVFVPEPQYRIVRMRSGGAKN